MNKKKAIYALNKIFPAHRSLRHRPVQIQSRCNSNISWVWLCIKKCVYDELVISFTSESHHPQLDCMIELEPAGQPNFSHLESLHSIREWKETSPELAIARWERQGWPHSLFHFAFMDKISDINSSQNSHGRNLMQWISLFFFFLNLIFNLQKCYLCSQMLIVVST